MARVTSAAFTERLAEASKVLSALSASLGELANFLRQLVQVVGWLVLLASSLSLLIHPHLSLEYLAVPGGGALAVLQSLIKPTQRDAHGNVAILTDESARIAAEVSRAESDTAQDTDIQHS